MEIETQQSRIPLPQTTKKKLNYYEKIGIVLSGIGAIGTHIAWSSVSVPYLKQIEGIQDPHTETWMTALLPLGAFLGSLPAGVLADKYGRKFVTAFSLLPMLISWFIICFVQTAAGLYGARFAAGIGCGAISIVAPIYYYEIIDSDKQRHIVHSVHRAFNMGILWAYVAYMQFSPKPDPEGKPFEGPRILATGLLSLFAMFVLFVPESPMWLENRGQKEKAEQAIKKITGCSITLDRIEPTKVIGNSGLRISAFRTINNTKDFILIMIFITLQQFVGVGPLMFYLKEDFDNAIHEEFEVWNYFVVLLLPTIIASFLSDMFKCIGEKFLLIISTFLMAICSFFLSGFAVILESREFRAPPLTTALPMILLTIYLIAFHIGLGPIPWIMMGKMFPINNRKMMYNLAATYSWLLLFITTKTHMNMILSIGHQGLFFIYVFVCLFGMFLAMCCVPRRVVQIQEEILENMDEINRCRNA